MAAGYFGEGSIFDAQASAAIEAAAKEAELPPGEGIGNMGV
jgi:hypothetical protein